MDKPTLVHGRWTPIKISPKDLEIAEAIKYLGQYITHVEFEKRYPELELTHTDWYRLTKGNTYRSNRVALKKRYERVFEEAWNEKKFRAIDSFDMAMLDHEEYKQYIKEKYNG
jgi:hypothetical protein